MRKIIILLFALSSAATTSAYADEQTPNCDSLNIMLMSMKDGLDINANWKTEIQASKEGDKPNKFRTFTVGDGNRSTEPSFAITCPDISVNYDGKVLKVKADSYQDIVDHLYKQLNRGVDLYNYRWYADTQSKTDLRVDKYSFDLERLLLTDGYIKLPEEKVVNNKLSFIPKEVAISYKINGGELKPMLVNRKVGKYSTDFKTAKTIDVYHKNPDLGNKGFGVERIFIDKENGVLQIYKDYAFPSK